MRWAQAEELGFDHAWTYDHVVWGGLPESEWFGAVPTLTAAATVTTRLSLGFFVASPNFRHPVPLARDLQEFTDLLDRVLSTDHVTSRGRWFSATDMRLRGEPIRPRNPLLLAGNGPRSVGYAARNGDGWLTPGPRATDLDEWYDAVAISSAQLDDSLARVGRDRTDLPTHLSRDSSPMASLTSKSVFDDMAGRAAELGFSDVISHWPRDTDPYRARVEVLREVSDGFTHR